MYVYRLAACRISTMVREGRWPSKTYERFNGTDVHVKTLGIIAWVALVTPSPTWHFGLTWRFNTSNASRNWTQKRPQMPLYMEHRVHCLKASDFVLCGWRPNINTVKQNVVIEPKNSLMMKESAISHGSRGKVIDEKPLLSKPLINGTIRMPLGLDFWSGTVTGHFLLCKTRPTR